MIDIKNVITEALDKGLPRELFDKNQRIHTTFSNATDEERHNSLKVILNSKLSSSKNFAGKNYLVTHQKLNEKDIDYIIDKHADELPDIGFHDKLNSSQIDKLIDNKKTIGYVSLNKNLSTKQRNKIFDKATDKNSYLPDRDETLQNLFGNSKSDKFKEKIFNAVKPYGGHFPLLGYSNTPNHLITNYLKNNNVVHGGRDLIEIAKNKNLSQENVNLIMDTHFNSLINMLSYDSKRFIQNLGTKLTSEHLDKILDEGNGLENYQEIVKHPNLSMKARNEIMTPRSTLSRYKEHYKDNENLPEEHFRQFFNDAEDKGYQLGVHQSLIFNYKNKIPKDIKDRILNHRSGKIARSLLFKNEPLKHSEIDSVLNRDFPFESADSKLMNYKAVLASSHISKEHVDSAIQYIKDNNFPEGDWIHSDLKDNKVYKKHYPNGHENKTITEALDRGINREVFDVKDRNDVINKKDKLSDKDLEVLSKHPNQSVIRTFLDSGDKLPDEVLENISKHKDGFVHQCLIRYAHKLPESVYSNLKDSKNSIVRQRVAFAASNPETIHHLIDEVEKPHTHNDNFHYYTHLLVSGNPHLTSEHIDRLIEYGNKDYNVIRDDLARHPNLTDEHLHKIIDGTINVGVLSAVASNPNLKPEHVDKLLDKAHMTGVVAMTSKLNDNHMNKILNSSWFRGEKVSMLYNQNLESQQIDKIIDNIKTPIESYYIRDLENEKRHNLTDEHIERLKNIK